MVTIKNLLNRLKKLKKGKSLIFAGLILTIVGTILSTVAFWQSENIFPNLFKTADYKTTVVEKFQSPNDWKPGDETEKKVTVKNEGSVCVKARASYTEEWKDKDGNELPLENNGKRVAIINFDNTTDWIKDGDYYYYQQDLLKNQTSTSFIKSVTYNKEISSDYACTTEGNIQKCTMSNGDYDGAEYTLTIKIEMIQCDGVEDLWPETLTYSTVLYNDGTLIINEPNTKRTSNITKHGNVIKEYDPLDEEHNYELSGASQQPWNAESLQIKSVEIGSPISPTSTAYWFRNLYNMEKGDFTNLDTSKVKNMRAMFAGCGRDANSFVLQGLSDWDTSEVTLMTQMFTASGQNATTWNIGDLSNWDTSKVINMMSIFAGSGQNATTWNNIGILSVHATPINTIFDSSPSAKATLNIYNNPTDYTNAFNGAATASGAGIIVNYSSDVTNIDNIIATKSDNSNVVKGELLQENTEPEETIEP